MGSLSEGFANLTDAILADYGPSLPGVRHPDRAGILLSRLLKPMLPSAIRCGPGVVVDVKDRCVGPFDIVASWEAYPAIGEGSGSLYPADGVLFVLQVRDWTESDLTEFGQLSAALKKLERKRTPPIVCGAVSFQALAMNQVSDFLKSQAGLSVDGVLTLGQHTMIRNSQGWYGSPEQVPFVSERGGAEAIKAFSLFLLHLSQSSIGMPFGYADYQHL